MSREKSPFNPEKFHSQHENKLDLLNSNQRLVEINQRLNRSIDKSQEIFDYGNTVVCEWDQYNNPVIKKVPSYFFKKNGLDENNIQGFQLASLFSSDQDNQDKLHFYFNELRDGRHPGSAETYVGEFQLKSKKWVEINTRQFSDENNRWKFYMAIHDIDHHIKTKNELIINPVTGLLNRAAFNQELDVIKADRRNHQYCIFFFDVDHLKVGNDINGHAFGDLLLKKTAEILKTNFRDFDKIFHLSGDEFAAVAFISREQAEEIVPRLTKQAAAVEMDKNCKYSDQIIPLPLHFSVGIASRDSQLQIPEDLLEMADLQMYKSKRAYKNDPNNSIFKYIMDYLHIHDTGSIEMFQLIDKNLDLLGKINNISKEKMSQLHLLTKLYQIGRFTIIDRQVYKNKILNQEKIDEMHDQINNIIFKIASDSAQCQNVAHYTNKFFENWDGSGPFKLSGLNIPRESRIFRIALAASAIELKNLDVASELTKISGTVLDPNLVDNFLKHLNS